LIIDAHCHIWEEELMSEELRKIILDICAQHDFDPPQLLDGTVERLIREMDEAGIDKTVIVGIDYGYLFRGKIPAKEYNDYVANLIQEYPDRLIGLAGIDPRRGKEAIQELERCMNELGLSGVKLWPQTGFYPDEYSYFPFYERAQELGATILCHTGAPPPGTYLKYCHPVNLDKVAINFPDLKIIMAHVGDPWISEALTVATKNGNIYFDISGWEGQFKFAPVALMQTLAQAKLGCGIKKVLFGSDWPLFTPIVPLKDWVEGIKKLKLPPPLKLMGLPELNQEEKQMILGENAANIYNI